MGEGNDPDALARCIQYAYSAGLKTALYSGADQWCYIEVIHKLVGACKLDYIKIGSYQKQLGGLDSPITNQRMYKLNGGQYHDITHEFWKVKQ